MRGLLGLVIGLFVGLFVGAGAMYLTLRPPWGGGAAPAVTDAGVAAAPVDAGVPGKSKPRRRQAGRGGTMAVPPGGGESEETEPPVVSLTEVDRRLEWRGDDVALPATKVDMTSRSEARSLEQSEIDAVIQRQAGGVRDCVLRGATGTDLRASIEVKLLVDGNGRVLRSRIHAPRYLLDHGLLACAQKAVGGMRFPATGAPTLVTLPVELG